MTHSATARARLTSPDESAAIASLVHRLHRYRWVAGGCGTGRVRGTGAGVVVIGINLTARQIAAIRACGAHPGGLRISAYPGTMPGLVALGLVEQRQKASPSERRQVGWFLTPAGKERLRLVGAGDAGD